MKSLESMEVLFETFYMNIMPPETTSHICFLI